MTPEQLAEIEQRWGKMMGSDNQYMRNISSNLFLDVRDLLAEVRRLNRMVDVSCKALSDHGIGCPLCIYSLQWDCDAECEVAKNEADCWRKYLESEVAQDG